MFPVNTEILNVALIVPPLPRAIYDLKLYGGVPISSNVVNCAVAIPTPPIPIFVCPVATS